MLLVNWMVRETQVSALVGEEHAALPAGQDAQHALGYQDVPVAAGNREGVRLRRCDDNKRRARTVEGRRAT